MRVVRIVAEWRKDGHRESAYKFCLVCGLNTDALIADGEWMGYMSNVLRIAAYRGASHDNYL